MTYGEIAWTERSEGHIARHRIEPDEVEQVVFTRPRLVAAGRGGTKLVFGTTSAGRYLLVVLADGADGRGFVVTAREMTEPEQRVFRRKAR